jgi:hypothetical protein
LNSSQGSKSDTLIFSLRGLRRDAPRLFDEIYEKIFDSPTSRPDWVQKKPEAFFSDFERFDVRYSRYIANVKEALSPKCKNKNEPLLSTFENIVLEADLQEIVPHFGNLMWNDWQKSVGRNASYLHACYDKYGVGTDGKSVVVRSCKEYRGPSTSSNYDRNR